MCELSPQQTGTLNSCWKHLNFEKIAEGTVQKYLKDVTLLGQVFVKAEDGKQTIEQLLKQKGASVASFTLFMVGEGIEKKVDDFAAEVAAQAAAAAAKK